MKKDTTCVLQNMLFFAAWRLFSANPIQSAVFPNLVRSRVVAWYSLDQVSWEDEIGVNFISAEEQAGIAGLRFQLDKIFKYVVLNGSRLNARKWLQIAEHGMYNLENWTLDVSRSAPVAEPEALVSMPVGLVK